MEGKEAKAAYIWTYVLNTPFWAMYTLLPFILLKELGAEWYHITLLTTLKPVVSILSVYWSGYVTNRGDRLVPNVAVGLFLGHLPFFFFPWVENIWFFIGAFASYMLFYRGVIPAWMEILKLHEKEGARERVVAFGITAAYVGSAIFPIFFGLLMDDDLQVWRYIFPFCSAISLCSLYFQRKIPQGARPTGKITPVVNPWKKMWELMKERVDYRTFQIGFMIGGFGMMVIQPVLPQFFVETLGVNYTALGTAISMCKGVGFAMTSGLWAKWMGKTDIFRFSAVVVFLFSFFPLLLLGGQISYLFFFLAYFGYGVMQAGSQLAWKLSGPIFSQEEDSSIFTTVNVFAVGLRGLVANPLGGLLAVYYGPVGVMILGSLLCLLAALQFRESAKTVPVADVRTP